EPPGIQRRADIQNAARDVAQRAIDLRTIRLTQIVITGIADYADDLLPNRIGVIGELVEALADRVAAAEVGIDERLIHDHRWRISGNLFGQEVASGDPANLHRAEEAGGNWHLNRTDRLVRAAGQAHERRHDKDHVAAHRSLLRNACALDA